MNAQPTSRATTADSVQSIAASGVNSVSERMEGEDMEAQQLCEQQTTRSVAEIVAQLEGSLQCIGKGENRRGRQ